MLNHRFNCSNTLYSVMFINERNMNMSLIKIKAKDSVLESDYEFENYPESAIQSFDNSTPIDKYKNI